ncbi:tetratricopeptide repeat protein [Caulobacter vibrioides]|uniref:tetratricopeptide repeat protein n=1 Tax=Caulobacter vibrioides TaxID=155892 RepID=UPI000CA80FD7|nr:hypothetical protein [Caulobacter vibrioides]ATC23856.2 hypothetical protein CA608_04575 [Caulobacter vibrioides]PLR15935.1 hypothetical protein CVUC_02230 [Caulobacter vibrioides]
MAESSSAPRKKRPARPEPLTTTDPTEIALEALSKDRPPPGAALALVLEQKRLVSWQVANERAAFMLRLCGAVVAAAALLVFAAMVWSASQSKALVIEPFSVPPDLAANGLTGQVVASRLLDRMADIQGKAQSVRAPNSFARAWDGGIEVQIPSTGVTLGELMRVLRDWLGQDRHISGEVVRTPAGLSIAVRTGEGAAVVIEGREAEIQGLLLKAGEAAFGQVEPYRYAVYLRSEKRWPESQAVLQSLVKQGTASDKGWGHVGLGALARGMGDEPLALAHYRAGVAAAPWQYLPWLNLSHSQTLLGDLDAARVSIRNAQQRLNRRGEVRQGMLESERISAKSQRAMLEGDFMTARNGWAELVTDKHYGPAVGVATSRLGWAYLELHEVQAAKRAQLTYAKADQYQDTLEEVGVRLALAEDDLQGVFDIADRTAERVKTVPATNAVRRCAIEPFAALAMARLGDLPGAQARVNATPEDCYDALIIRGRIAALAGDRAGSDRWFGRAVARAPSVPFAQTAWADVRLARGDQSGALKQAEAAHRLAPRFADPLKLIGDVRLARGDAKGAVKAYQQAAERAPRWGGLYLAWGEALARQGRMDEAQKTWRAASGMDLSAADRTRLTGLMARL